MPQPRVPTNVLALKGAYKKDPQRLKDRENEPVNVNPIGEAPDWLTDEEKESWATIVSKCIDGVLGEADHIAVSITSRLLARYIIGEATGQEQSLLNKYLGQLGMIPTERSKIAIKKKKPKNAFDD